MLFVLLCATSSALHRVVHSVLQDDTVGNQFDAPISSLPVHTIVHVANCALLMIIALCFPVDVLFNYICVALWSFAVHRPADWPTRAAAGLCAAAWWLLSDYTIVGATAAYYNVISVPYHLGSLCMEAWPECPWLTLLCAVQSAVAMFYWLSLFVGFTQHPMLLDCVVLPLFFKHDACALGGWLSKATACRSDAKPHVH